MSTILVNNVKSYTGDTVTISGSNILVQGKTTLGDGSGTDTLKVRADLSLSGSAQVSGSIIPATYGSNAKHDLGSSTKQWKDLYVDGIAYVDTLGAVGNDFVTNAYVKTATINTIMASGSVLNHNLMVSGNVKLSGSIIPSKPVASSPVHDLGSSTSQWKDLYVDGTAYIDTVQAGDSGGTGTINVYSASTASLYTSASLSSIRFENLPTNATEAALHGTGSLYLSGSVVNKSKALFVFVG
jgi:hypothetical protein